MRDIFRAYKIMTSRRYRIISILVTVLGAIATFGFMYYSGEFIVEIFIALLGTWIFMMLDTEVLAGISIRHSNNMNYIRSSQVAGDFIKKVFVGDYVCTAIKMFFMLVIPSISALIIRDEASIFYILIAIGIWISSITITSIINLIVRRIGKTIWSRTIYIYLFQCVFSILISVWTVLQELAGKISVEMISGALLIVMIALLVLFENIGYRDAYKGFKTGYEEGKC